MRRVAAAVADVCRRVWMATDPLRRGLVPLSVLFEAVGVSHTALPELSLAVAARHLIGERYVSGPHAVDGLLGDAQPLAGLMFRLGGDGLAFVRADDILSRRRFTAAHELGHAVLHRDQLNTLLADATISESDDATTEVEREANHFAAELLMLEAVMRWHERVVNR